MYEVNYGTVFIKLKGHKGKSTNRTKFKMTYCAFFVRMIVYFKFGFRSRRVFFYAFVARIMTVDVFIRMQYRKQYSKYDC